MRDALTKARECVSAFEAQFGLITPSERDALHESIAALLTQVRNETLEEAAKEADEFSHDHDGGAAADVIARNIRSLKSQPPAIEG